MMTVGEIYFNKYLVKSLIGKGGTSEVYLAENIKLGNYWAIKESFKSDIDEGLLAEPNILKQLSHPAIPKIIDIEEDEEAIYIIEEYISGINLKVFKQNNDIICEEMIINFSIQICDILNYLHSRQPRPIIYRDVKPQNIICTEENILKLVDFGIAREYKDDCLSDTVQIGTRGYAAPEQYGIGQSDVRTDIFGLGITMYYLITGKSLSEPPYKIQSIRELNNKISTGLENIILKCCELIPDNRYQTVDKLLNDLNSLNACEIKKRPNIDIVVDNNIVEKTTYKEKKITKIITIGLIGAAFGVGVTHTTLIIASSISKKRKVAVLELNNSNDFKDLAIMIEGGKAEKKVFFRYQKVDYYYGITYETFLARYKEKYDVILLDCGTYDEGYGLDEFIRSDIKLVIGHAIDWKVKELLDFNERTHQYDRFCKWLYGIPFLEGEHIKEISEHIGNKTYSIPFCPNPFLPDDMVKNTMKKIINF